MDHIKCCLSYFLPLNVFCDVPVREIVVVCFQVLQSFYIGIMNILFPYIFPALYRFFCLYLCCYHIIQVESFFLRQLLPCQLLYFAEWSFQLCLSVYLDVYPFLLFRNILDLRSSAGLIYFYALDDSLGNRIFIFCFSSGSP